jgi:hypothetical protein
VQNTELRPLGAGEMLDRAITLYVRWFAPIVIVLAVVAVPVTVLQAVVAPHAAHAFSDMARVFSSAGDPAASRAAAQALSRDNQSSPLTVLVIFVAAVVRVLTWCALVSVVASAYAGTRTSVAQAYRFALGRWLPQVVVSLAFLVLGIFASIPIFVLYFIVFLGAIGLSALHQTAAMIGLLIVGGLVFFALLCTVGPLVFMAYELASVAAIVETANPVEAIGIGLRRAFAPGMKRRTVVAGLVLMLVSQLGTVPLIALAAVAAAVTHVDALYFAILGAGGVLLEGIVATFVVVYAVDVRVRREGFDIVVADAPPAPA